MTKLPNDYFPADDLDAPRTDIKHLGAAGYIPPEKMFAEGCPKCRGTGRFISYGGRVLGPCYACKGAGKTVYKTSPETRAKSQARAATKRVEKAKSIGEQAAAWIVANPAEAAWLNTAAKRNTDRGGSFTFPADIIAKLAQYGSLTDGQLAAVQRLMAKDAERDAQRAADRAARQAQAPNADVTKLDEAFGIARARAERTGQMGVFVKPLRLTANGISIAIRPGTPGSTWDGMLFAKSEDGERKLGYFKGGKYFPQTANEAEAAAVLACATDPQAAVVAYAKAWSRCGVCGQQLLNDVSIEAGMGPICRSKFGW